MQTPSLTTPASHQPAVQRKSFALLIVLALLNTMGITLMLPIVPFLVLKYLAQPQQLAAIVGWLTATYSICQLIAAPVLGVLSDRFGRRPLLFICILGSALGYLIFGFGGALWLLFLGRMIDGLTGGNISILFGYVADITAPRDRGKYFGMLGSAAGIGSIIGAGVGWLLTRLGNRQLGLIALGLVGLSYLLLGSIAFLATPLLLIAGIMLYAGAGSLVENAVRGLVSTMAGQHEQGRVSGAMQAVQSLGWIIGPLVGGFLYSGWGHFQAYVSAASLIVLAMVCVWIALPLMQRPEPDPTAP